LLAGGSFVAVATSAAGSMQPLDWSRLDWSAVARHSQACLQEHPGPAAIGCILSPVARPASVSSGSQPESTAPPLYSTAMITDQPSAPPAKRPAKPAAATAAGHGTAPSARPAAGSAVTPTVRPTLSPPLEPGDE
jgi:hypothetical protein